MQTTAQKVLALRRKDWTLPEIVEKTGLAKSTVYYHIHATPLSAEKRAAISEASRKLAVRIAAKRRGKSERSFRRVSIWDRNSVFLVSHLLFDGTLRRTDLSYQSRSSALLNQVRIAMQQFYNYPPKKYLDAASGVYRISYYNVALGEYIIGMVKELISKISTLDQVLQLEFLRSFFDDEGCMDFRPQRGLRRIRGYQKDVQILTLVQQLLKQVGIESRIVMPNEVVIVGKKNLTTFQELIGFSKGVRINGNRSNSLWKKSLEKRVLLQRAIASFKK